MAPFWIWETWVSKMPIPSSIENVEALEDLLSTPTPQVIETFSRLRGDLIILGVGGKMGPTLARMAARAAREVGGKMTVYGVSRFSQRDLPTQLEKIGVRPISCDLLERAMVAKLPECPNVVAMTGMKFGSGDQAALTWAMNCLVPAHVCERYSHSRIVAFSTGNVYPLSPVSAGGSRESDPLAPVGEYAITALGRERVFEYFSRKSGIPLAIARLNYANETRYGVLVDLALAVAQGEPIDLSMGHVNVIWQGDANAMALAAFDYVASPPFVFNLAGPETLSVRRLAERLGELLGKAPQFHGTEAADALLSNGQFGHAWFGYPRVPLETMLRWIADWVQRGGESLGKPTHFGTRDGKF